ncbi:GNAT family N-acetyltransferase [bacterium]|nr:MAG: GNAT family N-acetyltransferase [bacterium]
MPGKILFADLDLARRLERTDAWVGLESAKIYCSLSPDSGATAVPVPGGYAVFRGIGSPLTQVLGLGMTGPVTEGEMEQLEDFFRARGSRAQIELCPFADRSVFRLLASRAYAPLEGSNMLVKRVKQDGRVPVPPALPPVRRCAPEEAELWAHTVMQGFTGEQALPEDNVAVLASLFKHPETACFLAALGGQPAGAGALSVHQGVAALYGATTLRGYRRQGVQLAIIQALVNCSIDLGCELAYSLTQPGSISQRNLERQGFGVAYTRFTMIREMKHR